MSGIIQLATAGYRTGVTNPLMADEEQVQTSTEETSEVEEETTGTDEAETSEDTSEETESSEESSEQDSDDGNTELSKAQKIAKDQKKRAEKAEADAKALRDKYEPKEKTRAPKQSEEVAALREETARANERATRAELAASGFKHPDDQKYILEAAKRLGVEPLEAAGDELVAGKLKRMGEARATKDATPAPSGRGGKSGGTDVGKLADKVAAGGALPSDPALAEKVQSELARRSQARA